MAEPANLPASASQCYCCAAYGLLRPAARRGLCAFCAVLSGMCEHGHRMAARYEAAADE